MQRYDITAVKHICLKIHVPTVNIEQQKKCDVMRKLVKKNTGTILGPRTVLHAILGTSGQREIT